MDSEGNEDTPLAGLRELPFNEMCFYLRTNNLLTAAILH